MIITSRYQFLHHPIEDENRGIGELRFSARVRRTLEGIVQDSKDSPDFYKFSTDDAAVGVRNIYGYSAYFYKDKVTGDVDINIV